MNKSCTGSGFSLIELIIYVGITAVVVVVAFNVILSVMEMRERTVVVGDVQQELRFAMDHMVNTMLRSIDVNVGASTFDNDNGVLSLSVSDPSYDPTVYFLSAGSIYIQEGAGEGLPLTGPTIEVDQLLLENRTSPYANPTIKITMHGLDTSSGTGLIYEGETTLVTSITLRQ